MTELRDNLAAHRFEFDEQGETAFADYRREGGGLIIDHVEAPVALRGKGTAGRLMQAIAVQARIERRSIIPLCGYAAAWLARHPEHADLLG